MIKNIRHDIFLYFVASLAIIISASNYLVPLSEDVSLHFFHAIRLVKNGGLYTRWAEVMPPTIYLLYSIPVMLHELIGLGYVFWLNLFANTLGILSILMINSSLKANALDNGLRKNFLAAALIIFFILPIFTNSTNDRETLFLIFSTPWIINKLLKLQSRFLVIIFACIGFSIKQYDILYPLLFILLGPRFDRGYFRQVFSRENIFIGLILVVINAVYVVCFTAYYTEILPVLLVGYKGYYRFAYTTLIYAVFIYGVIIYYLWKIPALKSYLKGYIILFIISILLISLNGNVRYNMNYPFSAAALAIMHIMWNVNEKTRYTIKMLLGIMLVSTLLIQVMIVYYVNKKDETPERAACYKHISDYTAKPYIYLSAGSWAFQKNYSSYDLFYFDNIQHQLAIDHMWMLPWLYNHLDDKNAYVVKDYIRKNMIEALHRSDNVSIIVVVSRQHEKLPENFNILQFMRDNLDLKSELDGYVKVDNIDGCESYQVDKTEIWQKSLANYNR